MISRKDFHCSFPFLTRVEKDHQSSTSETRRTSLLVAIEIVGVTAPKLNRRNLPRQQRTGQASCPPWSNPPFCKTLENHFIEQEMFSREAVPPATGSGSRLGSAVVIVAGRTLATQTWANFQEYSPLSRHVSLSSRSGCNSKITV